MELAWLPQLKELYNNSKLKIEDKCMSIESYLTVKSTRTLESEG